MPRSVPEWIGANDDTPVPPRVKLRVFNRGVPERGIPPKCCAGCGRRLYPGDKKTCDHAKALINGGENREANLQTLGECCEPDKTKADIAEKSAVYQKSVKHHGFQRRASRPMPGGRNSNIKITMAYGPVDRATGEPLGRRRT